MSGATEGLSRQLVAAHDLKAVVRSMKALAASSIAQYDRAVGALEDYYRTVRLGLTACLMEKQDALSATPEPIAEGAIGAIVFGSDQGLVGRFNDVLVKFALRRLEALPGKTRQIWAVGDRVHALLTETSLPAPCLMVVPSSVDGIAPLVGEIVIAIDRAREQGTIRDVYFFHNRPMPGALYEPIETQLLPLGGGWRHAIAATQWPTHILPQVIHSTAPAIEAFIKEYLFVSLFQACAESLASENASRLAAMQRAEKNIEAILEELNRQYHRVRQEAIDEELFELISGYEALAQRR